MPSIQPAPDSFTPFNSLDVRTRLAFSTVRIVRNDGGSGTGFFLTFDKARRDQLVIITNRHVVEGAVTLAIRVTKSKDGQPLVGQHAILEFRSKGAWIAHPDETIDLVAIPVTSNAFRSATVDGTAVERLDIHVLWNESRFIPTPEEFATFVPAEELLMVGYPIGMSDEVNNLPIFRRGIAATGPGYDYEGKPEFVVDMACFPGSSGSPIYAYTPPLSLQSGGGIEITDAGAKARLIGVLWGGPQFNITGEVDAVPIPTTMRSSVEFGIPSHLGFAIKATQLLAFAEQLSMGTVTS